MAPINLLPFEILQLISEDLEKDEILSLRLACQDLNAKLQEPHLDAIYRTQRILMVPAFLKSLIEYLKDPSAPNLRARELRVCFRTPYSDRDPREYHRSENPRQAEHGRTISVRATCASAQQFDFLKIIFSTFPRVRTISFEYKPQKELSCFEYSLLYRERDQLHPLIRPTPGRKPSLRARQYVTDRMALNKLYDQDLILLDVVESIAAARSNINTISFSNTLGERGIRMSSFDLHPKRLLQLRFGFKNLRRLDLYLSFDREGSACRGFGLFLDNIGSQLEELSLFNTGDMFWLKERRVLILPTSVGLPKLKRLEISCMTLHVGNLKSFLSHCQNGLETLTIIGCWFRRYNLERASAFLLLRYAAESLRSLREFELQIMYGYDAWGPDYHTHSPPAMVLRVNGDWSSEDTCRTRFTRTSDGFVATLDDIASKIRENSGLDDNEQSDIFWDSIKTLDFTRDESSNS
ncbi:hypothetical protein TWF718_005332 [Orbilia javanica]|uniref:F-box domain-containing protein n=1 Tax=Orbilia javanica TaxID=47235 RepID=A0AAN8N191_9PEZI